MKIKREIVTPYLAFIFVIVCVSGIFMFFHLMDDYTNVVHEFLGLGFALFAVLHITINWKSIRNYFSKGMLALPAVVILIISIAFITIGKIKGNLEQEMLMKLLKAPAASSFKILNGDYQRAVSLLHAQGVTVKDASESIEQISARNGKSPEEVIEWILK
ncbi:MAG: uncharacterized protein JWO58_263 [Chitinophagaceae bacterium]|nr:uncharacterized protein [Chitinophagaceae bacterium]